MPNATKAAFLAGLSSHDNNQGRTAAVKGMRFPTKDPICGITVDEGSALSSERGGETFSFCSDHCRQQFLSTPPEIKSEGTSRVRGNCAWCPSWCPFCARREIPKKVPLDFIGIRVNGLDHPP